MVSEVDHPQHYNACGPKDEDGTAKFEVIKVIEDWGLGFCLGNALKYICRAPHKGKQLEDLKKALWYLHRVKRHPETFRTCCVVRFFSEEVSEAWELPGRLASAVESISVGEPSGAIAELEHYIAELKARLVRPTESDNPLT
jgi:hypothetical protein